MIGCKQAIWNELYVPTWGNAFETVYWRELLCEALNALRYIRPIVVFTLFQNRAVEGHSPGLLLLVGKAETFEWNRKPDDIAIFCQAAFGAPHSIKTVVVALALGIDCVLLDAERVREKIVRAVLVVKCIQKNADPIVLVQVFAFR